MATLRVRLGETIRRFRQDAGLSQEGFAAACGLHRTYMGAIERGERNISLDNIERVAKALGKPVSALFIAAERVH